MDPIMTNSLQLEKGHKLGTNPEFYKTDNFHNMPSDKSKPEGGKHFEKMGSFPNGPRKDKSLSASNKYSAYRIKNDITANNKDKREINLKKRQTVNVNSSSKENTNFNFERGQAQNGNGVSGLANVGNGHSPLNNFGFNAGLGNSEKIIDKGKSRTKDARKHKSDFHSDSSAYKDNGGTLNSSTRLGKIDLNKAGHINLNKNFSQNMDIFESETRAGRRVDPREKNKSLSAGKKSKNAALNPLTTNNGLTFGSFTLNNLRANSLSKEQQQRKSNQPPTMSATNQLNHINGVISVNGFANNSMNTSGIGSGGKKDATGMHPLMHIPKELKMNSLGYNDREKISKAIDKNIMKPVDNPEMRLDKENMTAMRTADKHVFKIGKVKARNVYMHGEDKEQKKRTKTQKLEDGFLTGPNYVYGQHVGRPRTRSKSNNKTGVKNF